jgi:hypothetical protein
MTHIYPGRLAASPDDPFVVFLVGICIHKPLAVHAWWPALAPMLPMVRELESHPEKGLLGSRFFLSWPVIQVVQYWRSFEQLEAFARNPDDPHLPAWKRFNQVVGKSEVVGVFHETYLVEPGSYEAIYVNMPRYGLGKATATAPATGTRLTARRRLGGQNEAAVESAE